MAAKKTTKKSAATAKKAAAPKKAAATEKAATAAAPKKTAAKKAAAPKKTAAKKAAAAPKKTAAKKAAAAPKKTAAKKAAAAPKKTAAKKAAAAPKKAAAAAPKTAAAAPKKAAAAPKKAAAAPKKAAAAPKKAAAVAASPSPSSSAVAASWARIEGWFAAHHPSLSLGLRPGVSAKDIAAAEKKLGVTFPADFRDSLLVHDGQEDNPGVRIVPFAQRLGSLASFVTCWTDDRSAYDEKEMAERFDWTGDDERVRQVHFHPKHIPVAGSPFWDYDRLLLDFIPGPKGTAGQVIVRDDIEFVFLCTTFGELLAKTAQGLEDGTIVVSPTTYDSALEYRAAGSPKPIREYRYFA
jgi:cell wall assembly regulator SMI1